MKVVSLAYHDAVVGEDFDSSGFPGAGPALYKLDVQELGKHLQQVAAVAQPGLAGSRQFLSKIAPGEVPLFLTFDDGGISAVTRIADLLEMFGLRGHFFIATNYIDSPAFLTKEQIRELRRRGHLIGSHSRSHPARISECTWEEMVAEWAESAATLSEIVGEAITCASVPGGFYTRRVAAAASRAGIEVLFTSEPMKQCVYVDQCVVLGRFAIRRGMTSSHAVALASTAWSSSQVKQYVFWNLKKVAKRLAGTSYERTRKKILSRRMK